MGRNTYKYIEQGNQSEGIASDKCNNKETVKVIRHCTSDVDFIREVQNNMIYHIYCTNSSTSTLNSDLFCKPIFVKFGEKVSSMQVTFLMLAMVVYRPNCENQQSGLDTITFPFLHFQGAKNKVCDVSL